MSIAGNIIGSVNSIISGVLIFIYFLFIIGIVSITVSVFWILGATLSEKITERRHKRELEATLKKLKDG